MGARVDSWCHRDMLSRAVEPHLRVPRPLQKDLSNQSLAPPAAAAHGAENSPGARGLEAPRAAERSGRAPSPSGGGSPLESPG